MLLLIKPPKSIRFFFQLGTVIFLIVLVVLNRMGKTFSNCESVCPFGGAEGLIYYIKHQQFLCVLTEYNVSLFLMLIVLTFFAKRSFCSYLCPLGFIFEKLHSLRSKLGIRSSMPAAGIDQILQLGRYAVLVLVLIATWFAGDLIFRCYDPYFALFSLHGHGIAWSSYGVLGFTVAGAFLVPMLWCRYLCPLGACMDVGSRYSLLRISRASETCSQCRLCEKACPFAIPVPERQEVTDRNCSLCLKCRDACPEKGTLKIKVAGKKNAIGAWILPLIIAAFLLAAHSISPLLKVPTFEKVVQQPEGENSEVTERIFIVSGLSCRGRSQMLYESLQYLPGIYKLKVYAGERKLILQYDPHSLNEKDIKECIESRMMDPETGQESAPFEVLKWH